MRLESVKAGNILIWNGRGLSDSKIVRVERITKTQIIIDGHRFRKADGYPVGQTSIWNRVNVTIPKEGEVEKVREARLYVSLVNKIEGACCRNNLKQMPLSALQKLNTLLESL